MPDTGDFLICFKSLSSAEASELRYFIYWFVKVGYIILNNDWAYWKSVLCPQNTIILHYYECSLLTNRYHYVLIDASHETV